MNGINALIAARHELDTNKKVNVGLLTESMAVFTDYASVATFVFRYMAEDPETIFQVQSVPTTLTKETLAELWNKTKPASSPEAANNKFFERLASAIDQAGYFEE